ncbi:MAG TPA: DUF4236 domain-containing protein [Alphaproteobacteria bacterium]|nr:DUF4236 domain-containing protein [Alphaproteobacteria bacterium]
MRVHLQIKLPPGLTHKLSEKKRRGEVSAGVHEPSTNINKQSRRYITVEVPGTGLSWREKRHHLLLVFAYSLHARLLRMIWHRSDPGRKPPSIARL